MLSGGCNETVEYDSVIMPNNRISKHSRRIDYDNGKPLALTDLGMVQFPQSTTNKTAGTVKNSRPA